MASERTVTRSRPAIFRAIGAVAISVLVVLSSALAGPGRAANAATSNTAPASQNLGPIGYDGVVLNDAVFAGEQRTYNFEVGPGPGSVQVYLGDLWYDVDVGLFRGGEAPGQWSGGCGAGCIVGVGPSAMRVVQFLQPKVFVQTVDQGRYTLLVRPRTGSSGGSQPYTLRIAVTLPVCGETGKEGGYMLSLASNPTRPRRLDLVTLTAYVLPPFTDLFEFDWSIDGRGLGTGGQIFRAPGFDLTGNRPGEHQVTVTARGVRAYPDPDQPAVPPTLTLTCSITFD